MKKLDIVNLTTTCKLVINSEDKKDLLKWLRYLNLKYTAKDQTELQPHEYRIIVKERLFSAAIYFLKGKVIAVKGKAIKPKKNAIYDENIVVGLDVKGNLIYKVLNDV